MLVRTRILVIPGLLLMVFWASLLQAVFPNVEADNLPGIVALVPGVFAGCLLARVKCPYSRLFGYAWLVWYFVGTFNVLASSLVLGSYYSNLSLDEATAIYMWGTLAYVMGLYAFDRIDPKRLVPVYGAPTVHENIPKVCEFGILIFPVAWLASLYVSVGYVPILSGASIVDEMYQLNYGPLYPYSSFLIFSIVYAAFRALSATATWHRYAFWTLCFTYILISVVDGKRVYALAGIGGILAISFRLLNKRAWTHVLPFAGYALAGLYIIVLAVRVGNGANAADSAYSGFTLVGVEFRDFAYTVNHFKPGEILNYAWATSTLGSIVNGQLLNAFGFDKAELVSLDSARAWAAIWGISFGIRTGILSELWFAYGVSGLIGLFIFGVFCAWCIRLLRKASGTKELLPMSAVFGMLLLSITGQSTSTFGVLPLFAYAYLGMWVVSRLIRRATTR